MKTEASLEAPYPYQPETGVGHLPPLCRLETWYNYVAAKMNVLSILLILVIALLITCDVTCRMLFHIPLHGITDLEILFLSVAGFSTLSLVICQRQSMQIDLLYNGFTAPVQRVLYVFALLTGIISFCLVGVSALETGLFKWTRETSILDLPEWPVIAYSGLAVCMVVLGCVFQLGHIIQSLAARGRLRELLLGLLLTGALWAIPVAYKYFDMHMSELAIGGMAFLILLCLLLVRVPLPFAMTSVGILGLLILSRRAESVFHNISTIPFYYTSTVIMLAIPLFILMGEFVALSGLSSDLFLVARKWLGRLPGGLAIASVGGCAGFGAVCGDSMATVLTMSKVSLPSMDESGYQHTLSCGALAAGGTLGILIPPSMGFIIYAMITEESVGKLFVAGIVPGILLTGIFSVIIAVLVKRNPQLAPKSPYYPLKERLASLVLLLPVIVLFYVVVAGILNGWFTPAEGAGVGTVLALLFAVGRRRMTWSAFQEAMTNSMLMFGKLFMLFIGLYILGSFLAMSRLPMLLADFVAGLHMNKYLVLALIIVLYIFLGCVMNIIPMMLLTLPSLFPTVVALGFDPVWFGVISVIVMEMGMITPPVGLNVFTLAGMRPDIPMATIFKGIAPFFMGMVLCVLLLIFFPQISLCLL